MGDDAGASRARRPRAHGHPEGRQRQHGRPRIVRDHARVAARPPRCELRAVEQERDDEVGADAAHEVGHLVEPREVLADKRCGGHPASGVDHVERPLPDVDRFPPELPGRQGSREVVLA
jgi:hypothetical protein